MRGLEFSLKEAWKLGVGIKFTGAGGCKAAGVVSRGYCRKSCFEIFFVSKFFFKKTRKEGGLTTQARARPACRQGPACLAGGTRPSPQAGQVVHNFFLKNFKFFFCTFRLFILLFLVLFF